MRALLAFLALFAVALGLVALATPPAWQLVSLLTTVPFHRVGHGRPGGRFVAAGALAAPQ